MTAGIPSDPATVGPYLLVRKLGEGGMGVVHLATDPAGRSVALKVLRGPVSNDAEARHRLAREVESLRRVRDNRVVGVLDADVEGEVPYLVTRYVPGQSLEARIRSEGPMSARQVAQLGLELAGVIISIHTAGVVHRDIKPTNVMMVGDQPILIDFGIAHVVDDAQITRSGLVMGTPGYLPPELVSGGRVTTATDWWAWGATLVFAATGRQPFGGGQVATILERVRLGQADVNGIEPQLRSVLAATLNPDPARRPGAADLLSQLDALLAATPAGPVPSPPVGAQAPLASTTSTQAQLAPTQAQLAPTQAQLAPTRAQLAPTQIDPGQPTQPHWPLPTPADAAVLQPPEPAPGPRPHDPYQGSPYQAWPPAPLPPSYPIGGYPPGPYPAPVPYPGPGPYPGSGATRAGSVPGELSPPDVSPRGIGTLLAVGATLCAVTAVAPGAGLLLLVVLTVLARTLHRSARGWRRRRAHRQWVPGQPAGGDIAVAVLALPWRLLVSCLTGVVALILPVLVAVVTALAGAAVFSRASGGTGAPDLSVQPFGSLALTVAMAAALLCAWWGPGGRSLRAGAGLAAAAVSGRRPVRWVVSAVCVLTVAAALLVIARPGYEPDWAPFAPASVRTA